MQNLIRVYDFREDAEAKLLALIFEIRFIGFRFFYVIESVASRCRKYDGNGGSGVPLSFTCCGAVSALGVSDLRGNGRVTSLGAQFK